ncbi:MAG: hypothetical protein PHT02_00570 [Tissierellia bacterium]|nr:hypothetical protein [Tissierellia bacterium]
MANQELRQGINNITLVGVVKEHNLKLNKDKDGNYINGSIVVKTGEFSEIEMGVFVGEKTKDKSKTKKVFEVFQKFIDGEYLTLASCKNDEDRESVAKVRVYGSKDFTPHFKEDIFKVKDTGEVKTKIKIDLGFGNISVDNSINEKDYKAEFEVEMYVTSVKEETKKDEETGRVVVSGWTPVYGGKVIPMEVIAGTIVDDDGEEVNFAEDVLNQIEEGMTIDVWGEINYQSIITKTSKGGGLGKAKVEEHKEYINDLIIVGADIQEDEEKEFEMELIKKAKIERDTTIENTKNEEKKEDKKGTGVKGSSASGDKPKRERPKF